MKIVLLQPPISSLTLCNFYVDDLNVINAYSFILKYKLHASWVVFGSDF